MYSSASCKAPYHWGAHVFVSLLLKAAKSNFSLPKYCIVLNSVQTHEAIGTEVKEKVFFISVFHLNYCIWLWGPQHKKHTDPLESV